MDTGCVIIAVALGFGIPMAASCALAFCVVRQTVSVIIHVFVIGLVAQHASGCVAYRRRVVFIDRAITVIVVGCAAFFRQIRCSILVAVVTVTAQRRAVWCSGSTQAFEVVCKPIAVTVRIFVVHGAASTVGFVESAVAVFIVEWSRITDLC